MTVETTNITSGPYTGNGLSDEYDYDFRVDNKNQLIVYETDDDGVQTTLTVDTDYTVGGIGVDEGGTITRVAGNLPAGYKWYIRSNYQATQETDFASQGGFFPRIHARAFDKLTFLVQQLTDRISRSFRFSDGYSGSASTTLETPVANAYVRWNAAGTALTNDTSINSLTDPYLGAQVSDPTVRKDGSTLQNGDWYFNTAIDAVKVYNSGWSEITNQIPVTSTIESMRSLTEGTDSLRIYAKSHTTEGDGGHGVFRWVSGASVATYVDNGGTIIVPTGGDGSAAWLREYTGAVNVLWFDGDFSTQFAAALAIGNDVLVPQGSYTGDITISGTGRTVVFEDVAITGDITITALYHSTVRGRCSCTDLRIFGIQNCIIEAIRGDFMYIQNRAGVSGVYWNVFKSLSFNALQVRQAALTSGTSAINQNAFRDCTFKGGHDNNTFTDADTNAVGVNVWLRDEVAEVAEGGTYPTYTEDYTEGSFSGSAKWDAIYTNPFEFDGFDFSYSDGFGTTPDISWGIKNESTTSCEPWLKNGFIEDVDRAYSGAECNAVNVEVRDSVIYKTPGDHQTSAGRVESGSLLVPIIPAWDNFELKKALIGVTTTGTISYVAPDDVPYTTVMSMGGVAIKLDNSAAGSTSTAWWTLVFEAKFTGPVNFVVRGVNYNNISIQVNSGSIVFNTSMQNPSNDEEGYESIMVTCEAGDTITCRIYPPTSGIAYITGVGSFYGKNFMALTQPTEEQFPRVDVGVSSTSTSAWSTCAVIGIGNRQKDQIRAKLFGTLSGTGGFRAEIEFKVEADGSGTVTVTSLNNMVTPSSAGVTIAVAVQAVATAANTVEIQVQKGFYGSSINSVSFRAFSRKIGVATVTIDGDSYTTRLQRNFYGD